MVHAETMPKRNNNFFLFAIIIIMFAFGAMTALGILSQHAAGGNFGQVNCNENNIFAKASNYQGIVQEYCMTEDGVIGVRVYSNGKLVNEYYMTENIKSLQDFLDYLEKENLRLVYFLNSVFK